MRIFENGHENKNRDEEKGLLDEERKSKMSVKNLSKVSDEGTLILKNLNLDIIKGSIVGIIGPSGSGKSTFLRALNRLWDPPSDTVFLDGVDITNLSVVSVRRRVGMLFQTPTLFDGTVADNIRYGPSLQGQKLTDEKVHELLQLADLEPSMASRSAHGLSVGQAQRVALARTVANEPEMLLLDEPTSALDPVSTQNIEDSILKLRSIKGLTVVMVSHSIKQIQRMADVVCLVVDGEIVEVLPVNDLSLSSHPTAKKFLELST